MAVTAKNLLEAAQEQHASIVDRKDKLEHSAKPLLDIQWQFMAGMLAGANEIVRALIDRVQAEQGRAPEVEHCPGVCCEEHAGSEHCEGCPTVRSER